MKLAHLLFVPVLALMLSASSCQTTATQVNPFAQCKTVGQCYLATNGTYLASEAAGKEILNNPNTPVSVKDAIKKADAATVVPMQELSKSYTLYRHVKADLNACASSDTSCKADGNQKVLNATANVGKWMTEATPLVNDFLKLAAGD